MPVHGIEPFLRRVPCWYLDHVQNIGPYHLHHKTFLKQSFLLDPRRPHKLPLLIIDLIIWAIVHHLVLQQQKDHTVSAKHPTGQGQQLALAARETTHPSGRMVFLPGESQSPVCWPSFLELLRDGVHLVALSVLLILFRYNRIRGARRDSSKVPI